MNTTIHLAVVCDEGYVIPTITMLTSVLHNRKKGQSYAIHVLGNNLSSFAQRKFKELEQPDFTLRLYPCSAERYENIHIPEGVGFNHVAMVKCDIAELLPQLDKVLFLDGDILVTRDLAELYHTELGNNVVAAVRELIGEHLGQHTLIGTSCYFNVGVMLLNLKVMREERLGEKIVQTKLQAPPTWLYAEQDPYNVVCQGRTLFLHPRWNFLSTITLSNIRMLPISAYNDFYHTSYADYTEMEEDAVIHHFATQKPWKNNTMRHAALWQKYHNLSPFGSTSLEHDPDYPPRPLPPSRFKHDIRLLGILPLLRVKSTPTSTSIRLLGLPIFKIKKRENSAQYLLFCFLPLFTIKTKVQ